MPEYQQMIAQVLGNQPSVEKLETDLKCLRKQIRGYETKKRKLGEALDSLDILSEDYDVEYEKI